MSRFLYSHIFPSFDWRESDITQDVFDSLHNWANVREKKNGTIPGMKATKHDELFEREPEARALASRNHFTGRRSMVVAVSTECPKCAGLLCPEVGEDLISGERAEFLYCLNCGKRVEDAITYNKTLPPKDKKDTCRNMVTRDRNFYPLRMGGN